MYALMDSFAASVVRAGSVILRLIRWQGFVCWYGGHMWALYGGSQSTWQICLRCPKAVRLSGSGTVEEAGARERIAWFQCGDPSHW